MCVPAQWWFSRVVTSLLKTINLLQIYVLFKSHRSLFPSFLSYLNQESTKLSMKLNKEASPAKLGELDTRFLRTLFLKQSNKGTSMLQSDIHLSSCYMDWSFSGDAPRWRSARTALIEMASHGEETCVGKPRTNGRGMRSSSSWDGRVGRRLANCGCLGTDSTDRWWRRRSVKFGHILLRASKSEPTDGRWSEALS